MFHSQNNRVPHQRSSGFTLVELLVVIVIISILAALITPAVISAISTSRRGAISQEIAMLDGALKNYKNNFGSYPPSNGAAFRDHLNKIFIYGGTDVTATNIPNALTGPEILVYCLGGNQVGLPGTYSTDKRAPLTGTTKKPALFDFDQSRLVTFNSTYSIPSTANGASPAYTFPVYMPPYPSTKTAPYAYFCSSRSGASAESYTVPAPTATPGIYGVARPYIVDQSNGTTPLALANSTSFQIICAGEDGNFGTGTAATPTETTLSSGTISGGVLPAITPAGRVKFCKLYVNSTNATYYYDPASEDDNLTNFYTGRLEDNKP